ncbi:solute-binding protein [Streptomyces poonensis]|uniref:Solute-binding protein n=2 Tax=Streptomyces poonensis TaxID=68255 RepID=A0A918UE87_9ACTN|nr:solute-binding protein [Streptomyces poonensis]GLJ88819.1 solute-binding protein [Streptomyces poonensis]
MVSALGMTATLGGCGGSGSGEVTLKLVAAEYGDSKANSSQAYWDDLAARYEKTHPGVRIDVSVYSWNDVDAKVRKMVDAGEAPDMAQIGAYADYADEGLLYQAGELLSIPVQADFLPQLVNAGTVHRIQYGMPFAASTRVLFYNKELFEEAGITSPPRTWKELAADAAALEDAGVKIPYALPLGPEEAQAETMQWMLSGGAGYLDDVGSYDLDSEQNVETFTWLKEELVDKGLTGPTAPAQLNRADAFAAFTRGEVGMLNGHPSLLRSAAEKGVEFGTVTMPGRTGGTHAAMGVADWMMAFKQNGHQREIGSFLDFVYSEENVLAFSRKYDLLPTTTTASEAMAASKSDAELAAFLDELPETELYPVGKTSWAEVSAAVKQRIGEAVAPDGDPRAVLDELQQVALKAENGA